jgi:uncharacterized membrane protein
MPVEGTSKEFLVAEYSALRAEVLATLSEVRALKRYIVLGCAGIWSWAATHPESPRALLFVPVVLTLLGGLRAWTYSRDFHFAHVYIGRLEQTLLEDAPGETRRKDAFPLGWEKYDKEGHNYVTVSAIIFWVALLLAAVVAVCVIHVGQPAHGVATSFTCTQKSQ